MSWVRRLCLFVFSIAGLLSLAALALTWVGPWTTQARSMLELRWYFITLEVLVCIAAVGLLTCLLISILSPRNPRESVIAEVPGGQITITRTAVVSQTKNIVEQDGTCIASAVYVRMRRRGHVRVSVRVKPKLPVDVVERGAALYDALGEGLAKVCGESVQSIDIIFTEPEQNSTLSTYVEQDSSHTTTVPLPTSRGTKVSQTSSGLSPAISVSVSALSTPASMVAESEPEATVAEVVVEPASSGQSAYEAAAFEPEGYDLADADTLTLEQQAPEEA